MAISDAVARNLTTIFVALMASFQAYAFLCGRRISGGYAALLSTAALLLILVATLTWDISRKARCGRRSRHHHVEEVCKGGICWHGVAPPSPASQLRFTLPRHLPWISKEEHETIGYSTFILLVT
ncbi:hypothetical protein Fmac_000238 [Flemingia macrophylla]|uniref:Uncharacterized protein n=1 Tax=Flemingia macrophylla TaxID=520843 RepID=A0ABD1NEC5_9FABA